MSGEEGGFPGGALVAFTVTQQAEDPMGSRPEHSGIGHSGGDGKPVAQRSSGHIDTRDFMRYVAAKIGTILVMCEKLLGREETPLRECGVKARSRMAFAEDKAITSSALWRGGIDI